LALGKWRKEKMEANLWDTDTVLISLKLLGVMSQVLLRTGRDCSRLKAWKTLVTMNKLSRSNRKLNMESTSWMSLIE
jgi:hypothetical protein